MHNTILKTTLFLNGGFLLCITWSTPDYAVLFGDIFVIFCFVCLMKQGLNVAQAILKLISSNNPSALAIHVAGTIGMCHHGLPWLCGILIIAVSQVAAALYIVCKCTYLVVAPSGSCGQVQSFHSAKKLIWGKNISPGCLKTLLLYLVETSIITKT